MSKRLTSRLLLLLKLFVGVTLLVIVLKRVDLSAFRGIELSSVWLVPALLIGLLIIVLKTLRWSSVLSSYFSHEMRFRDALPILFIGQLFGFATPSRAGNFIRANYLRKSIGLKKGALSVAIEIAMDITVMFILSVCAVVMFWDEMLSYFDGSFPFSSWLLFLTIGAMFLAVAAGVAVWLELPLLGKIGSYAGKLKKALRTLYSSLSPVVLLYQLSLTAGTWALASSVTYVCAMSLGLRGAFIPFMLIMALQSLLILLPVTVFGIGIREGTSYVLYPAIGIPADLAIPVVWLGTFFLAVVPALIGLVAYFTYRGTVRGDS